MELRLISYISKRDYTLFTNLASTSTPKTMQSYIGPPDHNRAC